MDLETFSDRLKFCMQNKKQPNGRPSTSYSIEKEIPISSSTIDNLKNSKFQPSVDNLIVLSRYFEVSIDWLLTGENFVPRLGIDDINAVSALADKIVSITKSAAEIETPVSRVCAEP